MKAYYLLLLLLLASVDGLTQLTPNLSINTYGNCPQSDLQGSTTPCGLTFLKNTVHMTVASISVNSVTFRIKKCDNTNFGAGTATIKESTNATLGNVVCGTPYPSSSGQSVSSGSSNVNIIFTVNINPGETKYYAGVFYSTAANARYYTNVIAITNNTPFAPTLVAPPNGTTYSGVPSQVPFSWNKNNATGVCNYSIRLVNLNGAVILNYQNVGDVSSYNYPGGGFAPGNTYRWIVRATRISNSASWSESASPYQFTINSPTINAPTLVAPTTNTIYTTVPGSITFQWNKNNANGVCNYSIKLQNTTTNTVVLNYFNAGDNNSYVYNASSLTAGSNYQWIIRAIDVANAINWKETAVPFTFVVNQNTGLRLTSGINATTFPTSSGTGILKKCQQKDISFSFTNTSSTSIQRAVKLYLTDANNNLISTVWSKVFSLAAGASITYTRSEPGLNEGVNINPGNYKLVLKAIESNNVDNVDFNTATTVPVINTGINPSSISVQDGCNTYTCVQWNSNIAPTGTGWTTAPLEYREAFDYLCSKFIINQTQFANTINNDLLREELAKITFRGLFQSSLTSHASTGPATVADNFPTIYPDLLPGAPNSSNYSREARALLYLEYRKTGSQETDGTSPFDRDNNYFNLMSPINRQFVIKVLLEAFNIKPTPPASVSFGTNVFTDVTSSVEMRGYIHRALQLGIINASPSFNPNIPMMRKDALLILARLLKQYDANQISPRPNPVGADYFTPNLISTTRSASLPGMESGNFNSYTKTSFGITGLMPLVFAHSYNSVLTELPEYFFDEQPLGVGWTHYYNCYIRRMTDDASGNIRTVVFWGDGTTNFFTQSGNTYTPENAGLYVNLSFAAETSSSTSKFTYRTKNQITYTFTQPVGRNNLWVLTEIKDRNNNALTLQWVQGVGRTIGSVTINTFRVSRVTEPGGRYLSFQYLANTNRIASVTANALKDNGTLSTRSISFTYANNNTDLATYTDLRGNITTYTYDNINDPSRAHLLMKIKLPKGNEVTNTYENRKARSSEMAGQYKTTVNPVITHADPNNAIVSTISTTRNNATISSTVKFDNLGNTRNIKTSGAELNIGYNATQKTKPETFQNVTTGLSAGMEYDTKGNVLKVTKTGGAGTTPIIESYTYTTENDIFTYTNGRGYVTSFGYTNKNLTSITDAAGSVTTISLNPNGNGTVERITNQAGIYTTYGYDRFGNPSSTTLMGTITAQAKYDEWSRLYESIDPKGVRTFIAYEPNDLIRRVTKDTGNLNIGTGYGYDTNDNLRFITNPNGHVTTLTYNQDLDQLIEYEFAGFKKKYAYNEDGTLKTFTSQNNKTFTYVYDAADGSLKDDGYAAYTYYPDRSVQTITHKANGSVITYNYDGFKRVSSIEYKAAGNAITNIVGYQYDANNNVTLIIYPNNLQVGYAYDELDRMTRVFNAGNNATYASYTYLPDGRLRTQTNGNGTKVFYGYDNLGRLDSIGNLFANNAAIAGFKYKMDLLGNHLEEAENIPNGLAFPNLANETIIYTHDNANRMKTQGNTTYSYDDNGNNTGATGGFVVNQTFDDKDNLLTSNKPAIVAEYDALENRRTRNATRYVLDILGGSNVLMETDVSGNPLAFYIHGLGLVCRLDANRANPHYYHYDYRGSTVAITNASQQVTHRYLYGAFGEMYNQSENGFINNYRYVGKYGVQYESNDLYFMRARYFNPTNGRFLGEDPIYSTNLFQYSNNNSINYYDYDGKAANAILVGAVFGGISELPGAIWDAGESVYYAYQGINSWVKGENAAANVYMETAYHMVDKANKNIISGMISGAVSAAIAQSKALKTVRQRLSKLLNILSPQMPSIKKTVQATLDDKLIHPLSKVIGKTGALKLIDLRTRLGKLARNQLKDLLKEGLWELSGNFLPNAFGLSNEEAAQQLADYLFGD